MSYGQTYSSPRALANIDAIVNFMAGNPSSSVSSICIASGITYENCRRYVRFLKERGIVRAPENTRDNYSLTEESAALVAELHVDADTYKPYDRSEREVEFKRRFVSKWALHCVRDPLVEALFGKAQVAA